MANADRANIHPTAVIHADARVAASCRVGPFCVIGEGVELGEECELISHVVIEGPARIGKKNRFFPFSVIGSEPQDLKFKGEKTRLEMGDGNTVRECVTIHRGTPGGGGLTRVGSNLLIMAYSHIAHDCVVGDNVIMANGATLAGHVTIEEWAVVGAMSAVHQFCRVGTHAYIGGGTIVTQDVLPFSKTSAAREARAYGANSIGLERRGFSKQRIAAIKQAFRVISNSKLNTSQAVDRLKKESKSEDDDVALLVRFIEGSQRGVIK